MTEHRPLLHAIVIALLLIASGRLPAFAGEEARQVQTPLTVTDIAGREVTVNVPARRLLLGEGRQLYLVASLAPEDPLSHIVAWRNDLIEADPATYAQYLDVFPDLAKLPVFKGQEESLIDIESAVIQKPDAVLLNLEAMRANEDAKYVEKLAAFDIPVLYVDFRHQPLENTEPTIRLLGKIMGREQRAEGIIAFRHKAMAQVTDVIAENKPEPPRVFIERIGGYSQDCCLSFGPENFGKYVELAGGHNIGSDLLPSTFGQLNQQLAKWFHPELFADLDPDATFAEYHRRFLPIDYRPGYAVSLSDDPS
ncbi:ABC transporter substrate-binding protein [Mesorhizobium sp. AaZ16]|uniref:ABC transporter substrate-binding protein n=1 Tax=Mesorhizobium sp. AaZ16 TaxID=3402289 RepID=UPI00374FACDB